MNYSNSRQIFSVYRGIVTNIDKTPIPTKEYSSGDCIYVRGRKIQLLNSKGSGGEGKIFSLNIPGYVAKLYSPKANTLDKYNKLSLMIKKGRQYINIIPKNVAWPLEIIFQHKKGGAIGYVMKEAKGMPLADIIFGGPATIKEYFPSWKRTDLIDLSINMVRTFEKLHKLGVIIGDINGDNILVENKDKIYFVDTDSYQIEKFPCPVGKIDFSHPKLLNTKFDSVYRDAETEYFSLAVLLFKILTLGINPYARKGGGSPGENIKRGIFPYKFGNISDRGAPDFSKKIWSNFPYFLKEMFFNVFNNSQYYNDDQWIRKLYKYKYYISNYNHKYHYINDLYPVRYKFDNVVNNTNTVINSNTAPKSFKNKKNVLGFIKKIWR